MSKVYVVMQNCRNKHTDETSDVIAVCDSRELAERTISEEKEQINKDWSNIIDFNDGWEVEIDEPGIYTIADTTDYDYFFSVWVVEMELTTK